MLREDYCFLQCGLFLEDHRQSTDVSPSFVSPSFVSLVASQNDFSGRSRDESWIRNRGKNWMGGNKRFSFCSLSLSVNADQEDDVTENQANESIFLTTSDALLSKEKGEGNSSSSAAFNMTKHLWAGAVAAMVSRTFIAPLERLKLEYVVRNEKCNLMALITRIASNEGVKGFWKGNFVNLLRTAPFKAINFYAYDTYRDSLQRWTGNEEATNFERFIAGAAAGITATVLCLPMDTIRTILVAPGGEALGGVIGAFRHMIRTEGFLSLYKGLAPSIVSMAPSGAVFYGVYDILKSAYLHSPEGKRRTEFMKEEGKELTALEQLELGPLRTLLYGAIAGCCSEAATYPFEVVRRQLQMQAQASKMNAWRTCVTVVERGGVSALYAGLAPSLLQVLPSAAISYFVYEFMKIVLHVG